MKASNNIGINTYKSGRRLIVFSYDSENYFDRRNTIRNNERRKIFDRRKLERR